MRFFLFFVVVFLGHQLSEYLGVRIDVVDAYLDPLLFFPLVLYLTKRWNQYYSPTYKVPVVFVLVSVLVLVILFEFVFPAFSPRFEKDYYDFVAYGFGAAIFLILMND